MRTSLLITLVLTLLGIPGLSSAQSREISQAEYYIGVRSGFSATGKIFPRREIEIVEWFVEGKLTKTVKITSEHYSVDAIYILTEYRNDGKVKVDELVQIGKDFYCRDDAERWTKNAADCYVKPPPPKQKPQSSHFTIEKVKIDGTDGYAYSGIETYLGTQAGKAEPTRFLSDDKSILNADSTMRSRTIVTSIESSKVITSRKTYKYEYGVKLADIEAPIK